MAIKYGIERSLSASGPFVQIATVDDLLTYVDGTPPLSEDTEYFYRVRKLGAPNSGYSNIASATTDSGVDPDAAAWVARMTSPSITEQAAVNTFVIAEKASGNWSLIDEFYLMSLGATNGLIGAKSKSATAFGGITWDVNGATFNGINAYIDTDFNPSVDGVNYTLNDALALSVNSAVPINNNQSLWGAFSLVTPAGMGAWKNGGQFRALANSSNFNSGLLFDEHDSLNGFVRTSNSALKLIQGTDEADFSLPAAILPNDTVFIGAANDAGSPIHYGDSSISSLVIGAGVGFNHAAHNTNVRNLLTDLGVALP